MQVHSNGFTTRYRPGNRARTTWWRWIIASIISAIIRIVIIRRTSGWRWRRWKWIVLAIIIPTLIVAIRIIGIVITITAGSVGCSDERYGPDGGK